jgi:hypothetical protein
MSSMLQICRIMNPRATLYHLYHESQVLNGPNWDPSWHIMRGSCVLRVPWVARILKPDPFTRGWSFPVLWASGWIQCLKLWKADLGGENMGRKFAMYYFFEQLSYHFLDLIWLEISLESKNYRTCFGRNPWAGSVQSQGLRFTIPKELADTAPLVILRPSLLSNGWKRVSCGAVHIES